MEISELKYTITVTRWELLALVKGLEELETLQKKYPDERNGFNLNSQTTVDRLRINLKNAIK